MASSSTSSAPVSDSHHEDEDVVMDAACTECDVEAEAMTDLEQLCFQMQHSKTGVPVRNRRHQLKVQASVFTGSEAVTWLVGRKQVGRAEAVELGQAAMQTGLFTSIDGHEFEDRSHLYRFGKHDPSNRFASADVKGKPLDISVYGFVGCPFCRRAVEAAKSLAEEIDDDSVVTFSGEEMESRTVFNDFLSVKRKELAETTPVASFHSTSPLVYVLYGDVEHYIGGLDDMLMFLNGIKKFAGTKALEKYKPQSAVVTFFRGIPNIAKNLKATLPF